MAFMDGAAVLDSHSIIDVLLERCGRGSLRLTEPAYKVDEQNFIHVVDGALDAAIQLFYLRRDGVDVTSVAYLQKQEARVQSAMEWVASRMHGGQCRFGQGFGLSEIALLSALGWMRLRNAYPVDTVEEFTRFESVWSGRPSVSSTAPHV